MKASKLLADVNLDIKIERGLKILEFAAQYNLRKAFYRNCPLNRPADQRESHPKAGMLQRQEHAETADIMMQLNEEINNWPALPPPQAKSPRKQEPPLKTGKAMGTPEPSRSHSDQSSYSIHVKSNHSKEESDPEQESLDSLSNYESEATKRRLKSIAEEQSEANSASKLPITKNSKVKSKSSKSEIIRVEDRDDLSEKSKRSIQQRVEQVSEPSKEVSKFAKKEKTAEVASSSAIDLSHQSHKQDSKLKTDKKAERSINSKPASSNHYSFLDKSISRIVSHSSQLGSKSQTNRSSINFSLMRELSASFQDDQNMKMLLKLENCELEESYLQRRIVNRLEKGYKEASGIKDITWESLKLPKMEYGFVRPNYAHVLE